MGITSQYGPNSRSVRVSHIWQNHSVRDNLLTRFSDGDETAVGDLYSEYGGAVFTIAMSILKSRDLAADATQQTFVKAWRNASTYDSSREFAPWIYAIARRTAIDIWRSEKRREHVSVEGDIDVVEFPPGIEEAWEVFEIRSALDKLSVEEREVVRLTHFVGYTHAQVADKLGVAVGTVKSRSHRAHQRLAALLQHLIEE